MGGSLGGLTAALVLRDAGCDVRVCERSAAALEARGAGIAVLDETLRYFVERRGVSPDTICSTTNWIRFLHADGTVQFEQRRRYRFSSWNTIYRALLGCIEPDRYLLGHEIRTFSSDIGSVEVGLADARHLSVDLLVCADGINSTARQALLPDVRPQYSGYVARRAPSRVTLTPTTHAVLHDAITYQVLPSSHILVYPIPGPDGSLADGHRLVNFVWYRNVKQGADLDALMTDGTGVRHSVSLPPGAARGSAVEEMRASARAQLALPIAEAVTGVDRPFVQAVYDVEVPHMAVGRVCLIGDAAFAVRPHAAAGTAKAAADGWALAEELTASSGRVPAALARWEPRQLALGRSLLQRTREIGDASQFTGTSRPGDPRLIFGLYEPGR